MVNKVKKFLQGFIMSKNINNKMIIDEKEMRKNNPELYFELLKRKKQKYLLRSLSISILALILTFMTVIIITSVEIEKGVIKEDIQEKISVAIKNGADLNAIKQIYKNRNMMRQNIFSNITDKKNVYSYEIVLSEILADIRANQYLMTKEGVDTVFIKSVDALIKDYNYSDPFDKLENIQKEYFNNIRMKSVSNYYLIENDLSKLADELYNKNNLVNQYLRDSNLSFWLSISALIFSFIMSSYQLYINRPNKLFSLFRSASEEALNKYPIEERKYENSNKT